MSDSVFTLSIISVHMQWIRTWTSSSLNSVSYVLRHSPLVIGLSLDREGWAVISALIDGANRAGIQFDRELIQRVVTNSEKKRLAISDDCLRIRCVQGHSTDSVAINYVERVPPEILYHGTATRFLEAIRREGL